MNQNELKEYIMTTCHYLSIDASEIEKGIYRLNFPQEIIHFFGEEMMDITFEKEKMNKAFYVTLESFITQRLASLAANKENGMTFASLYLSIEPVLERAKDYLDENVSLKILNKYHDKNQFLVVWCKISLKGHMVEEKIKGYKYNLETESVSELHFNTDDFFSKLEERKEKRVTREKTKLATEAALEKAKEEANLFAKDKTKEASNILAKEIQRIHDYYDLLHDEEAFAETFSDEEGNRKEALKKEREYLIEQQKNKYSFSEDDFVITPIEILFLEEKKECAEIDIISPFSNRIVKIDGDTKDLFLCELTGEKEGIFTLTSDNKFILKSKTYVCSNCAQCLDITQTKRCAVCDEIVCHKCAVRSDLSQAALCEKHSKSCNNCHKRVGLNEVINCRGCGGDFCKWCAQGDMCELCSGIF